LYFECIIDLNTFGVKTINFFFKRFFILDNKCIFTLERYLFKIIGLEIGLILVFLFIGFLMDLYVVVEK